jgi:drug/metabolite transporter (DMT)-like permease
MFALGLALLSAILFGASTPASKVLLASLDPFQLAGLLYLGAAIGMAPVVAFERREGERLRLDRANLLRLSGAVVAGGILAPVLLLMALHRTLAGSISLLLNLEMVATAVLGVLLFREHLGRRGWLGVAGVVAAGGIVAADGGTPGLVAGLLTTLACIFWGLDNHLTALIDGMTPARSTLAKGIVAGSTNLLLGLMHAPFVATPGVVVAALVVGALAYGVSIALYIVSAQALGATRAQAIFACAPVFGAGLAIGVLREPIEVGQVVAALLLIPSIAALFWSQHAHAHVHETTEHVHSHRHDDGHHLHDHTGASEWLRHSHVHRHERLVHAHPHWPDLHHRHVHDVE